MKVAIIGVNGFVGSAIARAVVLNDAFELVPVNRGDDLGDKLVDIDLVIHAANPSRRFRAEQNPEEDYIETVEKTFTAIKAARKKKFILVSSLSCRTQMNTNYGRNRRSCELLVLQEGGVVIRLGPMFGGSRTQDVLHDILEGRQVFISASTRYSYVDVNWAGEKVVELFDANNSLVEIGARNFISLNDLRERYSSASEFSDIDDSQVIEGEFEGPDARLVFKYADKEYEKLVNAKKL